MKKYFGAMALCAIMAPVTAMADINLSFADRPAEDSLLVTQIPISDLVTARTQRDVRQKTDRYALTPQGTALIKMDGEEPLNVTIAFTSDTAPLAEILAEPTDSLSVTVAGTPSTGYFVTTTGTPLMQGMTHLRKLSMPYEAKIRSLREHPQPDSVVNKLYEDYTAIFTDYLDKNADQPAAAYAILNVEDDQFLDYYPKLGPLAKNSILKPLVEKSYRTITKRAEARKLQHDLESGDALAPDFKLPDLNGKQVSLSDFRGKWVVLDFWGAWCGWCVKGFPALKEAYAKYDGKLEVIGVDCGDTPEAWRAAVERFKLPWVNLYNDPKAAGPKPEQLYGVQGFPTKAIISPEGKIKAIVTGDDPSFYTTLDALINK